MNVVDFEVEIKPREVEPPGGGGRVWSSFEIFKQLSHHLQTHQVIRAGVFQTLIQQLDLSTDY